MPKPEWLKEQEARWSYKTCKGCRHVGPVIGLTKNAGNGRQEMHKCNIHPTPVYLSMIACEDYER
jgi:hypothetical protein